MMNYAKFLIQQDEQHNYYFRFFTEHHSILVKGFACHNREACVSNIRELYNTVQKDHHYRFQTSEGCFFFEVTDNTHSVIAISRLYRTMGGMSYAVDELKRIMVMAVIEDDCLPSPSLTVKYNRRDRIAK